MFVKRILKYSFIQIFMFDCRSCAQMIAYDHFIFNVPKSSDMTKYTILALVKLPTNNKKISESA